MHLRVIGAIPFIASAAAAQATAGPYGQCGGIGYSGPTACGSGYFCTTYNPYYYQCYPGTSTQAPTSTPTSSSPTSTTSSSNQAVSPSASSSSSSRATTTLSTVTTTPATGTSGGSVPTTLQSGWYWIRAVESPNFHSYLQTQPTGTPGTAVLTSYTSAGQFNIVSGQLVYNRGSAAPLYMNVEDPTDKTQRKLQTWFNTTQNAYGTFAFQGDTVTWTVSDINRPNTAAWLVCENQQLFINTGAYAYMTPAGCADETIHSYGGSTANL
ncbi:carbohydrate-binding module family 1 protein [Diplogelasinospora grovesii]|uniref:Carbohydrate-binding module family 1 protein n=1 Tax=Diplogelasinospora grovesii TaxID=303347 RepID=A0AAN6MY40_9PEZI|nr:carbohydrate-binding module family 1 protein [Diplogelasinospora grovesii]